MEQKEIEECDALQKGSRAQKHDGTDDLNEYHKIRDERRERITEQGEPRLERREVRAEYPSFVDLYRRCQEIERHEQGAEEEHFMRQEEHGDEKHDIVVIVIPPHGRIGEPEHNDDFPEPEGKHAHMRVYPLLAVHEVRDKE